MSKQTVWVILLLVGCQPPEALMDTHLRVANLSVEAPAIKLCVDSRDVVADLPYPRVTRYLPVSIRSSSHVRVVQSDCSQGDALLERDLPIQAGWQTLVIFGKPGDAAHPLDVALLADEPDRPPAQAGRAKVRNFHTDIEAPPLDIGVSPAPGVRVLAFREVAYAHTPTGSAVGTLTGAGYVDGVPVPLPTASLYVWKSGSDTVLGWFATSSVPFQGDHVYSLFPAGRVISGTPEAIVCEDDTQLATVDHPYAECGRFVPMRP